MFFLHVFVDFQSFFTPKHCLEISGLRMCRVTRSLFLSKTFSGWIDRLILVNTNYLFRGCGKKHSSFNKMLLLHTINGNGRMIPLDGDG